MNKGQIKSMKKIRIKSIASILFGLFLIVISSCNKKTDCCAIIDVDVQIHYKNALGESLINSVDDFNESNIKVYYKNGNEFEYIFQGNLDYPNMHRVGEDENGNVILTVFPSNFYEGNQSTTLIELNENVSDTLVCEFDLEGSREVCTGAWLNGIEMNNRYIEVEK